MSSYIYLGQRGANKHFSFLLFCFYSTSPSVFLFHPILFSRLSRYPPPPPTPAPRHLFSAFLPLHTALLRQGFYQLCSVSDPMKSCQICGEKEAPSCIKMRQNKGVVLCQTTAALSSPQKMLAAVPTWKNTTVSDLLGDSSEKPPKDKTDVQKATAEQPHNCWSIFCLQV